MKENLIDRKKIILKIKQLNSKNWWGDEFDVRFYLLSKIKLIKNKSILDIGGGIGIISSEINPNNLIVNLDVSFNDLKLCKNNFANVNVVCGSMTNLPFKEKSFNIVVCAHLLEVAKLLDLNSKSQLNQNEETKFPTVQKTLSEITKSTSKKGKIFLTTPNNARYQTSKLNYHELKNAIKEYFTKYEIFFYNTYPKLSNKNRKLNLANILPKIFSKIINDEKLLKLLLSKDNGNGKNSVSFYVEINNGSKT
jgi:2-polyprenyl-3-methyl-5-hydroxy-6-metoxy-1,4-benzoquinol methylase